MTGKECAKYILKKINSLDRRVPQIKPLEETVDYICEHKVSVSRFGDGEFKWVYGFRQNSFQRQSRPLSKRLRQVLHEPVDNHILCIPEGAFRLDMYTPEARAWWENFDGKYRILWNNLFDMRRQYYSLYISRPYLDMREKEKAGERFAYISRIWDGKSVLIVEGEKTRLGVHNDLFRTCGRIRRILCPPVNAFTYYDEILHEILARVEPVDLVIIALGPTATILAYDCARLGIQAIDIGHIDIEYEWYKMGAVDKVAVKGKYVNEAGDGLRPLVIDTPDDPDYSRQIIAQIP